MTGPFETGSSSIDLSGPPWNVVEVKTLYILHQGASTTMYTDPEHTELFEPPEFIVPRGVATGIYAYIAADSDPGTKFSDGLSGRKNTLYWTAGNPPPSVTYGKVKADRTAFSFKVDWDHEDSEAHEFNITVITPDGRSVKLLVDPTIVEEPEIPPDL